MSKYNKFIVALGAALVVAGAGLSDGGISTSEWVQIAAAFLGSLGVYQVRNQE